MSNKDGTANTSRFFDLKGFLGVAASWAYFDLHWYRHLYRQALTSAGARDNAEIVAFYRDVGHLRGHVPNPLFDEAWYLRTYADVAHGVREGVLKSGFDHYCRFGHQDRSPHWLFSEFQYRNTYEDVNRQRLDELGLLNGYDHFLVLGCRQGRSGHPLFSAAVYRQSLEAARLGFSAPDARGGLYRHFLESCLDRLPESRVSWYFDPAWYAERHPHVMGEIEDGKWRCVLHHYLCNQEPEIYDPLPFYSESYYREANQDIDIVLLQGAYRNGYDHFLKFGIKEMRRPRKDIDLRRYATRKVIRDLKSDVADNVFEHLIRFGQHLAKAGDTAAAQAPPERIADAPGAEPDSVLPLEDHAKALFRLWSRHHLPLFARRPIDFSLAGAAELSVIMVGHNKISLTLQTIASLRANYSGNIELIFMDSGSSDETRAIEHYVAGAKIVHSNENIGFIRSCNQALAMVTAPLTLYLNNDLRLVHGAIAAAMARLAADPEIGAVGGKIIRTHGLLQEAGSILWRDGSTLGYMRDADADVPEANFVRDVDFCSAAFLMLPTELLVRLGGFDEHFIPAYYEDSDLCQRVWILGYRVAYDPAIVIEHLEYGSSSLTSAQIRLMEIGREKFVDKHKMLLDHQFPHGEARQIFARARNRGASRVLFIEDRLPSRDVGSGFVRSNDIVKAMVDIGCYVTIFPMLPIKYDSLALGRNFPDSVELMHNLTVEDFSQFLGERAGYYDFVWIARTHNLDRVVEILKEQESALPDDGLILDTEAVAAARDWEKDAIFGVPRVSAIEDAVNEELANAWICRKIVAVNPAEAELIRRASAADVAVLGHMRQITLTAEDFAARSGLLFVGAFHEEDSPNYDSVCWFIDEVLPHLDALLPPAVKFSVVGFYNPHVDLQRFAASERVIVVGAAKDLTPFYAANRVFVAPTRYAAGIPYKVHEAASHGIPVVGTELLRRQLGWTDGDEMLSAPADDPRQFAAKVAKLYHDSELWLSVRQSATHALATENSPEAYQRTLRAILRRDPGVAAHAVAAVDESERELASAAV